MAKKIVVSVVLLALFVFFMKYQWATPVRENGTGTPPDDPKQTTYSPLSAETIRGKSGTGYLFIYKNTAKMDLEITRPSKQDTTVYLSIAGAFTTLDSFTIDGLYVCKGKAGNTHKVNHSLGGGIKISGGECMIFSTEKGNLLTDSLLAILATQKGSLFQQIQCITKGVPARFKDVKLFQRRGIAVMNNGMIAIVESDKMITLADF